MREITSKFRSLFASLIIIVMVTSILSPMQVLASVDIEDSGSDSVEGQLGNESVEPTETTETTETTEAIETTGTTGTTETTETTETIETTVKSITIEDSIRKIKKYYFAGEFELAGYHSDYWILSALWGADTDLAKDIPWKNGKEPWNQSSFWTTGIDKANSTSNEDAGIIIGSVLLGKDPSNFGKQDVVQDLVNKQKEDGSFFTIWGESWAMIALDLMDAEYDREKHLSYILSKQSNGVFGGSDANGWILTALAPYKNAREDVKTAIERSVQSVHKGFQEKGEISDGWGANANGTAATLMGLAAVGEDLKSEKWTKDGKNIVELFIETYQQDDGSFWWKKNTAGAVGMSTEQALLALATIQKGESIFVQLQGNVEKVPETNTTVNVRIEGINKTLFPQQRVTVKTANKEATAFDATKVALEQAEIPYTASGDYISSINHEEHATFGSWDGWQYMVNGEYPNDYAGAYEIKDGDSIVWFYGNVGDIYEGTIDKVEDLTLRPEITIPSNLIEGNEIEIKVESNYNVFGSDYTLKEENVKTSIADAAITFNGDTFKTDKNGIARIPAEKAKVGTYEISVTKDIDGSYPRLLRQSKKIIIEEDSSPVIPNPTNDTAYLSIEGVDQGNLLPLMQSDISRGDTAFTLLKRVADEKNITLNYSGSGAGLYVKAIAGLAEFDHGPYSGWMYSVNGVFPQFSAGLYDLKKGDVVRWQYTTNLGKDLGEEVPSDKNESIVVVPSDKNFTLPTKPNEDVSLPVTMEFNSFILPNVKADRAGVKLDIPSGTAVTSAWDQKIQAPTTVTTSSADIAKISNAIPGKKLKGVQAHIKVGGNETIRFDRHVSLTFEGYGDKAAGFIDNRGKFTLIDKKDSQFTNADAFAYQAGRDLIIKTKHFTEFLVFDVVEETTDTMKEDVDAAIKGITEKLLRDGVQSEWEAIGLYKAGVKIPASYTEKFNEHLNDQVLTKSGKGRMKITDVERLLMAAAVLGINPENVDGKGFNLLEKIYNSEARTTGEDSLTFQGNNGVIFALIALDSKNYKVPATAKWTREKLVAELLKTQKSDGSWSLETRTDASASVDITAMALIALAPYDKDSEVKKAIAKTVSFLAAKQGATGGFNEAFAGGITSEAASQVIIALTANGINPRSEQFTKNGIDLMQHLLSFKAADGGFKHVAGDRSSNNMATEQALQALVAYDLFMNKKGPLYSFDEVPVKPVPNPEPTPKPEPTLPEFKDISTHWAKEYIEQAVELGLVKGYEDGTFKPNQSLTRAQAVSILVRALDLKTDKNNPFTDTQKYAKETQAELAAAFHHGLVNGKDGKFMPTEKVTRAQMALMFYRAYEIQNGHKYVASHYAPFTDMNNYGKEAKDAVDMLYELEMAAGEKGKYMPGNSTTRAHAVKMLIEFLNTK